MTQSITPSINRDERARRGLRAPARGLPSDPDALSLEELQRLLSSDCHYNATPTRNYGLIDPLERPSDLLFLCSCGERPRVERGTPPPRARVQHRPLPAGSESRAYHVACSACGKAAQPSLREWRAVVDWNFTHADSRGGALAQLPFFNLASLSRTEAVERLNGIKRDLLLRRALARKQREHGIEVGGRFIAKIEAYLGWVNVALRIATR